MSASQVDQNADILFERRGAAGVVTLNRPKVLNALNQKTWEELYAVFEEIQHDPEVRGVILTGGGDKAFIAGADISELAHVTAASCAHSSSCARKASTMPWVTALSTLGRLSVTTPAAPRRSNRMSAF